MPPAASSETTPTAKQIVFLFMAATVVAVVVFLCGVLVGRGVPLGGGGTSIAGSSASASVDLPTATLSSPSSEPSAAAGESTLSYYWRLDGSPSEPDLLGPGNAETDTNADTNEEGVDSPEPNETVADRDRVRVTVVDEASSPLPPAPAPASEPLPPAVPESSSASASVVTDGFSVQVMALRSHAAAQDVVTRLSDKGFPARVVLPPADAPIALFRVQVGPYADRAEAQRIRRRLQAEEQFEAFVTR